ncbi:MAG: cadherin-like beta sandwich domain-containing protein [Marinilabiliaceae bacterium]|nr:cadherin-like beta sandwich domain-containing protein [Marinilabiliaceae bacterium]
MKKLHFLVFVATIILGFFTLKAQEVSLTNPSFESGNYSGWTWTGANGYAWLGPNTDGDATKDGSYIEGIWNSSIGDVEFSQTVKGLTPGYYQVKALMTVSNNRLTTQRLFAESDGSSTSQLYGADTEPAYSSANLAILGTTEIYSFAGYATSSSESGPFKEVAVVKQVTGDSIKIGMRLNGKGSVLGYDFSYSTNEDAGFFKFDYFRLANVTTATLENIILSVGSLDADFDSTVYTYTATLPKLTTEVTPTAVVAAKGITATGLDAVDVSSGYGKSTIVVTCLDGSNKTYTINYTVLQASNDATLSGLTLSDGELSPAFNPDITDYKGYITLGTASVIPTATPNDSLASVTSGNNEVTLTNGHGKSEIVITAENGKTETYTIIYDYGYLSNPSFEEGVEGNPVGWTMAGSDGYAWVGPNTGGDQTKDGLYTMGIWNASIGDVSCHQSLTGLENGKYLVTGYMAVRKDRETTQRLYANSNSVLYGSESDYPQKNLDTLRMKLNESISFGNHTFSDGDEGPFKKLTTLVEITDGKLELGVKVNGKGSAHGFDFSYTDYGAAGFSKWDNFSVSNVTDLLIQSLSINNTPIDGLDATSIQLYQMDLPGGSTNVPAVTATAGNNVNIKVIPAETLPGTTEIVLYDADSTHTLSYFIDFNVLPSSDATLSNLTSTEGTLSPEFDAETLTYSLVVPKETASVTLNATANDQLASVSGDGLIDLSEGNTTVTIVVTAEDGSTLSYSVTISVATSIRNNEMNNVLVYPSVSNGIFHIQGLASGTIEVYDVSGLLVLSQKINSIKETISINNKGLYILKVKKENRTQLFKIVKN